MSESHAIVVRSNSPRTFDVSVMIEGEEVSLEYDQIGIADVRICIDRAQRKPQYTAMQTLVLRADFITHESQNALLKILEEPPASTRIVLVIPEDVTLLPTLLSRVQLVETAAEQPAAVFTAFLQASYGERLQQIEQALKKKDLAWQRACKQGLVAYLRSGRSANEALLYVAETVLTRGASNKMLFEQAALTLPVRK